MATKAMRVATLASVFGDFIGEIILICGVGFIAAIALKLGPPELFSIYFAAFVVIGSVIGKSVVKGLASAALGVLVRMIGIDPISSQERFTFGFFQLSNGISLVALMIGIFVLGEVFCQLEQTHTKTKDDRGHGDDEQSKARNRLSLEEFKPCIPHIVRSAFIGTGIGMLPGLGSTVAAFVAYGEGKRRAKKP